MSSTPGNYNSVYNQNIFRNIFRPEYTFANGQFQARIDSYLPGNVFVGDSSTNYIVDINGSVIHGQGGDIIVEGGFSTGSGNITVPNGNLVLTNGNAVVNGNIVGTTLNATRSVIANNIGSATIFCESGGFIFPYTLQPSYTSISFQSVTHPGFTAIPRKITLAPFTLFQFASSILSNNTSNPVMIDFTSSIPNFLTDSYVLRSI
jgi:hypothetical protein